MQDRTSAGRAGAAFVGAVSACALVLQYVLLLENTRDTVGPAFGTLRFLSYFTVLANLAVAVALAAVAAGPRSRLARTMMHPAVLGAIAVYIGVTGAIYAAILRHLWQPQGAQWWADSGLHYATPALFLAWWLCMAPHGALRWRHVPRWLVFPAAYLGWCLLRGAWLHEYPYPFVDMDALCPAAVARNAVGMLLVFVVAGGMVVMADHALARRRRRAPQ